MSDLDDRDDASNQPTAIPILGDAGADYPASPSAWAGTPVRAPLSSGEEQAGLEPGQDLDAQVLNDLVGRLGWGLASVIDSAALTWDPVETSVGQPNQNHWGTDPRIGAGDVFVVPYGMNAGGGYRQEMLIHFNPVKMFRSWDGKNWEDMGAHGVTGTPRGFAAGLMADGETVAIVAWDNSAGGEIVLSNDYGSTWGDTGADIAGTIDGSPSIGGCFNGRFFICNRSQLYYSDDLSSTDWTRISTSGFWTGAPPNSPVCFAASPNSCAFGINGGPSCIYSLDGDTWAALPLPTNPSDGIEALFWSSSHQLWIAVSSNGRIHTSPEDFSGWTERTKPNQVTAARAVVAQGRSVVMAGNEGLFITRDFENWRLLPEVRATDDGSYPFQWERLLLLNGRIWASRRRTVSGQSGIEYAQSAPLPAEFRKLGRW